MRKILLILSYVLIGFLVCLFIMGSYSYFSKDIFDDDNTTCMGIVSEDKTCNAIWIDIVGVKDGEFTAKVRSRIRNNLTFDSVYIDMNNEIDTFMLPFNFINIKKTVSGEIVSYYESDVVTVYENGDFNMFPFDKRYISSRARLVLVKGDNKEVIAPKDFSLCTQLPISFKVSELESIPRIFTEGTFRIKKRPIAKDEALLLAGRMSWFQCYFIIACIIIVIPIIAMLANNERISSVDMPTFVISIVTFRYFLVPEQYQIYACDAYFAAVVWGVGVVKLISIICNLYEPNVDFLVVRKGVKRLAGGAKQVVRALRGDGEPF